MTFERAIARDIDLLMDSILLEEEHAIFHDGLAKQRTPFVPCPIEVGNDPCDDWSEDDDEEWDW